VAEQADTGSGEAQAGPRLSLRGVAGPGAGTVIQVAGEPVTLGRDEHGPPALGGDGELSRRHATVAPFDGNRLIVEDLGSTNGTFVNGVRVSRPTVVGPGDAVWIGNTTMLVQREGEALPDVLPVEPPTPSAEAGFLSRIADLAARRPKRMMLFLGIFFVIAAAVGGPLAGILRDNNGFVDPNSESAKAEKALAEAGGVLPAPRTVVLVRTGKDVATSPTARAQVEGISKTIAANKNIARVVNFYTFKNPFFISDDGTTTFIAVFYKDVSQQTREDTAKSLQDKLEKKPTVVFGAQATVNQQLRERVRGDLGKAEAFGIPILFLVSIFVFRGVVAAILPIFVGIFTILGTFFVLRLINFATDVNVFAVNIVTGLGLGLAIDYSLFVVNRYREELARVGEGRPMSGLYGALPDAGASGTSRFAGSESEALRRTMLTAGRTILFSACTVAVALASLLVFPQPFLYSMGLGGAVTALVAVLTALIALPALLSLLGPRINKLAPKKWQQSALATAKGESGGSWYRFTRWVMRHPGAVAGVSIAVAVMIGAAFTRAEFTGVNARILPSDLSARSVSDALSQEFPADPSAQGQILVKAPPTAGARVQQFANKVGEMQGVAAVFPPQRLSNAVWEVDYQPWNDSLSNQSLDIVRNIRAGPNPFPVQVAGESAQFVDQKEIIGNRLPIALVILATATFVILFLMTGSVVLPIKSVIMNLITLCFTLGLLVLIFQDGRLEKLLGYSSPGAIDISQPILIAAIAFGLSTDYAVFLLGRIYEAHQNGAKDTEAVAIGLERTGRIVTQAAILFCIAIGAFATSSVLFIKEVGVGTAVAVIFDATIIRALLVPSLMVLLGRRNWWAPKPLRRLHDRIGLSES
jgi:RND superfamily putative drug exporter